MGFNQVVHKVGRGVSFRKLSRGATGGICGGGGGGGGMMVKDETVSQMPSGGSGYA